MSDFCKQTQDQSGYEIVVLILWVAGIVLDEEHGLSHLYFILTILALTFLQIVGAALFSVVYLLRLVYLAISGRSNMIDFRHPLTKKTEKRSVFTIWTSALFGIGAVAETLPFVLVGLGPDDADNLATCLSASAPYAWSDIGETALCLVGCVLAYLRLRSDGSRFTNSYGVGLICSAVIYIVGWYHVLVRLHSHS